MKKALIVGINYVGTDHQLNGCVNDALLWKKTFSTHFGFTDANNIKMLLDSAATTMGIWQGLQWLIDGAKPGDVLVFCYSGHGTQIPTSDYAGDLPFEASDVTDEDDGLFEAICPVDLDWEKRIIIDKNFWHLFSKLPAGVNLTCIMDCCHSGDGMREMLNPHIQPALSPVKNRFMVPPPAIALKAQVLRDSGTESSRYNNPALIDFAGCGSNQTSADAWIQNNRTYQGALTWYLNMALQEANYDGTYETILNLTRNHLVQSGYEQVPEVDTTTENMSKKFLQPLN